MAELTPPRQQAPRRWRWLLWLLVVFPLAALAAAVAFVAIMVPRTPSYDEIRKAHVQEKPSVILSADGQVLAVFRRTNREWVKLRDISPHVVHALLATEDQRFYSHHGIDVTRTLSAALHTLHGQVQGGSTITQQLARNMFPEEIGRAPTLTRKVKEAITAIKLEKTYSKNELLEMYLNTVPFLYNAVGIEMAARTYFDKSAGELDVLQAATLIGMLKGTTYYNPVLNPERAVQRRNIVLGQLVKNDQLSDRQFAALKGKPLGLDFSQQEDELGMAPHVTQQLKRWLIAWADRRGYNIYEDGLVVRTTIDTRLQQMAIEAVQRQADRLQEIADRAWAHPTSHHSRQLAEAFVRESPAFRSAVANGESEANAMERLLSDGAFMRALWHDKTQLESAFLAEDPRNGRILAWVGSRDFRKDQFDHVQQARRQPGSTFKPFVYGAAFAQGISPAQTFIDAPMAIQIDAKTVWKPGDVHETTGLPTTLYDGLVYSKNSITSQLVMQVGPQHVADVAYALGVRQSKLDVVPSLALGTSPVTLKEMVSAYSSIANNGAYIEPILVTRVEGRHGELLEEFAPPAPEQGLPVQATQELLDVMRGVVDRGTGAAIRSRFGLRGDLAGKTGTTQDNTDGWFMLMHPDIVTGAWVGFNDARITMGDSWGQGARNALLIAGDFLQQATQAHIVDTRATFDAPRLPPPEAPPPPEQILPGIADRLHDWLGNIFQGTPQQQQQMQPQQPQGQRPPAHIPESAEVSPSGPAIVVAPTMRPPAAYPPNTAILGAGPAPGRPDLRAPAQPAIRILREEPASGDARSAGVRILREVPAQQMN